MSLAEQTSNSSKKRVKMEEDVDDPSGGVPEYNGSDGSTPETSAARERPRKKLCGPIDEGPSIACNIIKFLIGPRRGFWANPEIRDTFLLPVDVVLASSGLVREKCELWNPDDFDERIIDLPTVDPKVFKIYVQWLRYGTIWYTRGEDEDKKAEQDRWEKSFALGHTMQDDDYKDALIDVAMKDMIETNKVWVNLPPVIYRNSAIYSVHRDLTLDTFLHLFGREQGGWSANLPVDMPTEFHFDVYKRMRPRLDKGFKRSTPAELFDMELDPCEYHEHVRLEKPCYKTRPEFQNHEL